MPSVYMEDKEFEKQDFSEYGLPTGDYEGCKFINCNFSNSDLSGNNFSECSFTGCNLSMAKLVKTTFQDVKFTECKLLGLHFEDCNDVLFTVDFMDCLLDLSSFYRLKLKKTNFKNTTLKEVDFTETDLTGCVFDNCDFLNTVFDHTILEKADLRTSYHYSIDPELNRIKKAKFSSAGIAGLLHKYDIDIS